VNGLNTSGSGSSLEIFLDPESRSRIQILMMENERILMMKMNDLIDKEWDLY